mgnify:CR=1 FL=1
MWAKTLWSKTKATRNHEELPQITDLLRVSLELQLDNVNSILLQCKIKFHEALKLSYNQSYREASEKFLESLAYLNPHTATSGGTNSNMPVDCLLMKGRIQLHKLLNEMNAPDASPAALLPQAKDVAALCDSILEVAADYKLLRHVDHSAKNHLGLLTISQFASTGTREQIITFTDECSYNSTFTFDDSLWQWIIDPQSLQEFLAARNSLTGFVVTSKTDSMASLLSSILRNSKI